VLYKECLDMVGQDDKEQHKDVNRHAGSCKAENRKLYNFLRDKYEGKNADRRKI